MPKVEPIAAYCRYVPVSMAMQNVLAARQSR